MGTGEAETDSARHFAGMPPLFKAVQRLVGSHIDASLINGRGGIEIGVVQRRIHDHLLHLRRGFVHVGATAARDHVNVVARFHRRGVHRPPPGLPARQTAAMERAYQRGWRLHEIEQEMREIESDIRSIDNLIFSLPPGDPERVSLLSERSFLRLDLMSLRAERARYL